MSKRPDFSYENIKILKKYCDDNKLDFAWKNEAQGHAVISNATTEAYVWVQRMVIGVRKRNGVELSKTLYDQDKPLLNKRFLDHLLFAGKKTTTHIAKGGITITRVPAGASL